MKHNDVDCDDDDDDDENEMKILCPVCQAKGMANENKVR